MIIARERIARKCEFRFAQKMMPYEKFGASLRQVVRAFNALRDIATHCVKFEYLFLHKPCTSKKLAHSAKK
jgi:hypothetical protein